MKPKVSVDGWGRIHVEIQSTGDGPEYDHADAHNAVLMWLRAKNANWKTMVALVPCSSTTPGMIAFREAD